MNELLFVHFESMIIVSKIYTEFTLSNCLLKSKKLLKKEVLSSAKATRLP